MKTKKDKILIVRITDEEDKMVKELRKNESINMSNLIREMIKKHYENRKSQS